MFSIYDNNFFCHHASGSGYLERIGSELSQRRSNKENSHLQNGYLHNIEKQLSTSYGGCPAAASDFHQKLLIVLSNIGHCKDELSHILYNRYKHVWLQHRYGSNSLSILQNLIYFVFGSYFVTIFRGKSSLVALALTLFLDGSESCLDWVFQMMGGEHFFFSIPCLWNRSGRGRAQTNKICRGLLCWVGKRYT